MLVLILYLCKLRGEVMKRVLLSIAFGLLLSVLTVVIGSNENRAFAFSGYGTGTGTQPYLITNCEQLQEMNDDLDADYSLVNNIDCSDTVTWNSGAGFEPIGDSFSTAFQGQFDGNGFEISNLYINLPNLNNVGLFGYINGAGIEDVGLVEPDITGEASVGGIAGVIFDGAGIRWSYVRGGSITGTVGATGGIVGNASLIDIQTVYSSAAITSPVNDGGLVGVNADILVLDSFWDTEASSQATSAGGGNGRTTAQMKTQSTFTNEGWDFDQDWNISGLVNDGYPFLRQHLGDEDYNGDDIPDEAQTSISSYISPLTGKRVLIDVGEGCEITTDDFIEESSLVAQDANWEYANGLFDFAGDCNTPGFTTTVTLMYYDVAINSLQMRKFNPNTNEYSTIGSASISTQTINGSQVAVVSYSITDGGELDMDQAVDGEFQDPAGLAMQITSDAAASDETTTSANGVTDQSLADTGMDLNLVVFAGFLLLTTGSGTLVWILQKS